VRRLIVGIVLLVLLPLTGCEAATVTHTVPGPTQTVVVPGPTQTVTVAPTASSVAQLSWVCQLNGTSQANSTEWNTGYILTAKNNGSVTATVTNGVTIEFYDAAGNGTDSDPVPMTGVIVPGQSQTFTGSDLITSDTAPTTCDVTQWN
jgi:hypothetical protein